MTSKVNVDIPYSIDDLNQIQRNALKQNKLEEAYIRPICFGSEKLGLRAVCLSKCCCCLLRWPRHGQEKKKWDGNVTSPYKQYENPLYSNNKII